VSNNIDYAVDTCSEKVIRKAENQHTNSTATSNKNKQKMNQNEVHYISSPDEHTTGSENTVIRKMRRKYKKLHNKGYYTSEEELDERFEQSDEKKELDKMRFERIDAKRTKRDIKASIAKATKTETKNYYESLLHPEDNNDDIEEVFNEDDKVVVQIDGQSTKRDPPFSKKLKHKKLKQKNQIKNEENVNSNNETTAGKCNENNLGSSDAERSDKRRKTGRKYQKPKKQIKHQTSNLQKMTT